ncbi:MAG: glycosyltransferase family 4 protein [Dongiaceae bacterium]
MSAALRPALRPERRLEVLTFTTLFPSAAAPQHGVFVENRLRHLVASGEVAAEVVAPVPWFPFRGGLFGRYARHAGTPRREHRHGLAIEHPRYPAIPRVGMSAAPFLLAAACVPLLRRRLAAGRRPALIDAHYFYPDGVAAVLLGRRFGLPVVITARGSDINQIADHALPRRLIRRAAAQAAGLVTVCQALKQRLVELGVEADRIRVMRNGVDLALFRPGDRAALRARLGLAGPTLLSVGSLIERKRHHLTIEALGRLPGVTLLIAGEGPLRRPLEAQAAAAGVAGRVRFLGPVGHEALPALYGAADLLVLASSREGWANVLLEAMACGTPVVASPAWGNPEVVAAPEAGRIATPCDAGGLAEAIAGLLAAPPPRAATRAYAERFGWEATTQAQLELFRAVAAAPPAGAPPGPAAAMLGSAAG